jgi:glutamine amidotransferase
MERKIVQIIDYGVGNLSSVGNMIIKSGGKPIFIKKPSDLNLKERIILPGVGSFDSGMKNLKDSNFIPVLNEAVNINKVPFIGICLGMQLLFDTSEEGVANGLGWISGSVTKFSFDNSSNLKIPHMGWNTVNVKKNSVLANIRDEKLRFYFVHSYHVNCNNKDNILMTTNYGITFVSAVQNDNIFGAQFHPEKSHRFGMDLLSKFLKI